MFFEVARAARGYDGYGAVNSPVRLAAQRTAVAPHKEERDAAQTQVVEPDQRSRGRFARGGTSEERELPEAPPLRRLIGPSMILIGVGIASGEYILFPFIASQAGLVFLWAAVVGILVQFFINMEIERYTLATGETALGGFMRMWKPWGGILGGRRDPRHDVAGLGDLGGHDRDVRLRRRRPERDRDRRPARDRRHADRLAGRLPDGREARVPQDRRRAGVPRRRAVRGDQLHRVQGHEPASSRASARSPSEIPIAILVGALAAAGAGGANNLVQSNWIRDKGFGMGKYVPRIVSPITGKEEAAPDERAPQLPAGRGQPGPLEGLVEAREPRAVRLLRR